MAIVRDPPAINYLVIGKGPGRSPAAVLTDENGNLIGTVGNPLNVSAVGPGGVGLATHAAQVDGTQLAQVTGTGVAGTPAAGVVSVQGISGGTPLVISVGGTAAFANGVETAVAGVAIAVLAANANRKGAVVQNVGANNVRVGIAGVTATTGIRLIAGADIEFSSPNIVTSAIYAIREGALDSTVFTAEFT